jgi:hypothetical protein
MKFIRKFTGEPGTLDFDEIWLASSWLQLIARKN